MVINCKSLTQLRIRLPRQGMSTPSPSSKELEWVCLIEAMRNAYFLPSSGLSHRHLEQSGASMPECRPPRTVKKKAPLRPSLSETVIRQPTSRPNASAKRANIHLLQRVKVQPGQVCASCNGPGYAHMGQCTSENERHFDKSYWQTLHGPLIEFKLLLCFSPGCKRLFHSDCPAGSVACTAFAQSIPKKERQNQSPRKTPTSRGDRVYPLQSSLTQDRYYLS